MKTIPPEFPAKAACASLLWPLQAKLGEGPAWIDDALWFVDIEGRNLHRFSPTSGERRSFPMPGRASFVVPASDGSMLVGMELTLQRVRDGVVLEEIASVGGDRHCRTNDATVDPKGRLWFGTLDLGFKSPTGLVYRFDGDGIASEAGGNCPITNGPAVSPDGNTLYHVDTLAGRVWAFDISTRDTLRDGRVFITIDPATGFPDGVTIDSEGCLWVALWGGWAVRRYSASGELLASIAVPCSQVTKIAFGGADLGTAFVTTARIGLSADDLLKQPDAGGLFTFPAPAPGRPGNSVVLR